MIVEIRGAEFQNKGAEMMLLAIIQQLRKTEPNVIFTIRPNSHIHYKDYMPLGIYPKAFTDIRNLRFTGFTKILPKEFFLRYGWIKDSQVDLLLDASGFSFSSEWGEFSTSRMAKECEKRKKYGTKIILLPQAFGPFNTKRIRKNMSKIIKYADLIYARDSNSYNYLMSLNIESINKIKISPDFTCSLIGQSATDKSKYGDVCIIPNLRMIDKTSLTHEEYATYLKKLINKLTNNKLNPFFLVHSLGEDNKLVNDINTKIKKPIPVMVESNPLIIKGVIGECKALFSSRFHGLVNGLTQGVPSFGTGWSHKYKSLFNDFDFSQGMLDINKPNFEDLIIELKQKELSAKLKSKAEQYQLKVNEMWEEINNLTFKK